MVEAGIKEVNLNKMDIEKLILGANNISNNIIRIKEQDYDRRKSKKENFNFFSAIVSGKNDKQHIEKYHSNVIGYFLNPTASHDFGTLFLKKFITILSGKGVTNLPGEQEVEKLELERERQTSAGRFIDISLELGRHWIVFIENKIMSGEQTDQMKDYCGFAEGNYENKLGIYLTLEGDEPGSTNTQERHDDLICMSYSDIIKWLEICCDDKEVKEHPHVLSALKQYIIIIKNLLNMMKEDKKAILEYLVENKKETVDLVKHFRILKDSILELIKEVRNKFFVDLVGNLKKKNADAIDYPKIKIHPGDPVWTGDFDNSFGLGFQIIGKDDRPFNYGGGGSEYCGNAIYINEINAHYADGIDQANVILLEYYGNEEKWNAIVNSTVDKIIEEVKNEVLEKYRSSLVISQLN